MSSFYGGKQGRTYNIVKRYDSVSQMVEAFSRGGAYSEVNYGQYVIIDTVLTQGRSSSLENGLLYRRGFDYNDSSSNYVKPDLEDQQFQDGNGFNKVLYQQAWAEWAQHPGNGAIYVGQIVGPEGRSPEIQIKKWSDFQEEATGTYNQIEIDLTPGKIDNNTFNDVIKAGYVNIRDQYGDIVSGKIAFDIPYSVIEAQIVGTNPYSASTVYQDNISKQHPFYYKWNYVIPGGKHGQDIQGITIENGSDIIGAQTDGFGNPIVDNDKYYSYSINNYDIGNPGDSDQAAARLTEHLGVWPYRVINNIQPIQKIRANIVSWDQNDDSSKQVQIGSLYRENSYPAETYLLCIKSGTIRKSDIPNSQQQQFIIGKEYLVNNGETLWRLVKIPETPPVDYINVNYTAGSPSTFNLHNIDYFTVDNDGKLYVFYSNSNEPYYLTTIRNIQNISFDNRMNIKNNQNITIQYKDGFVQEIGSLNSVLAVEREGDNLLILYADPRFRENIPQERRRVIPSWTDPITNITYENLVWYKFGPLGAQYHVQGVYTLADLKENGDLYNGFDSIENLQDRAGWIVTVFEEVQTQEGTLNIPHLYAYDYNDIDRSPSHRLHDGTLSHWYEIMTLSEQAVKPSGSIVISDEENAETPDPDSIFTDPNDLNGGGVWFVVSYGHDEFDDNIY